MRLSPWFTVLVAVLLSLPECVHGGEDADIRIWLSFGSGDPSRVTVCWEMPTESDGAVEFGVSQALGNEVQTKGMAIRHQLEIRLPATAGPWFYRVRAGVRHSRMIRVDGWEDRILRIAIVGNIGLSKKPWQAAVLRERPHVLMTVGDNVPSLHTGSAPAKSDDVSAFRALIDQAPELFRSTPFMPVLGNHDRELRPRGPKPPAEPVYDPEARAFRAFFALPDDEWKWSFDLPLFGIGFVALDLHHTSDFGTTWQTCHPFDPASEQLTWLRARIAQRKQPHLIVLYNERHATMRGLSKGGWWPELRRTSAVVTGFGYFAERAMVDGVPCINTAVSGTGAVYADPHSSFLRSEDNFALLTATASEHGGPATVHLHLKNLSGEVLDTCEIPQRAR